MRPPSSLMWIAFALIAVTALEAAGWFAACPGIPHSAALFDCRESVLKDTIAAAEDLKQALDSNEETRTTDFRMDDG